MLTAVLERLRRCHRPFRKTRLRGLRVAPFLLAIAIGLLASSAAYALPIDPLEPPSVDPPDPFVPWPNGFDWNVPSHFGPYRNGIVDYHWDPTTLTYDPAYVNPTSYPVQFDGCASANDEAARGNLAIDSAYTWTVAGATSAPPPNHTCQFTASYPAQGAYSVSLDVTPSGGTTTNHYVQQIVVKDWLIVSIGDSYGSGEGNPDIPQQHDALGFVNVGAVWEDRRCHRSAYAGPAQAALAIEAGDPKTSVTFLSFACSGATISRPTYDGDDPNKPQGSGILGPYRGAEPPAGILYGPLDRLPSQLTALAAAVGNRQIDALIISGGGNDIGFGNVAATCVVSARCYTASVHANFDPTNPTVDSLANVVQSEASQLPGRYDALANALRSVGPDGRPFINVAHVFLSEYPDPTRTDDGTICPAILDDILPGFSMTAAESQWAIGAVFQPLDGAVQQAAATHNTLAGEPWHYVGGVSAGFAGAGFGHGYCASNNWIRRALESAYLEGPQSLPAIGTKGTLHPTIAGHRVYRDQILAAIRPFLVSPLPPPTVPLPPAPTYTEVISGTRGSNGWITSSGNVLTVTAQAGANNVRIRGASVTVDGTVGCTVSGVTCTTQLIDATSTSPGQYMWTFSITAEGIHHLQFSASDVNGLVTNFADELKLDLNNPATPTVALASLPNAAGWYRQPVSVTFASTDTVSGSGGVMVEYHVDGGPAAFTTPGIAAAFSADGRHTIAYQAFDQAGRRSSQQSLNLNIDTTPPTVSVTGVSDGATYTLGNVPTPGCNTTDGTSGVATQATLQISGGTANGVGTFTATCSSAQDQAGNTAAAVTASYTVGYGFSGLLAPVNPPPTVNTGKAGKVYPIKWQLTTSNGSFVSPLSAVTSLTFTPTACGAFSSNPTNGLETESSGSSSLRYDSTANQYVYNWATPSAAGCYTLYLTLDSGQVFNAFFNLT